MLHVEDKPQGYHWIHSNCKLHPVVYYYSNSSDLQHYSLCFFNMKFKKK